MRLRVGMAALACTLLLMPLTAHAANAPVNKGMVVTPVRDYATLDPGVPVRKKITIENITDKPLDVTLTIQQFAVANYTYDYRFDAPRDDWIKLGTTQVQLQPGKSQTVDYTISPPNNASPGGHYFTIFASAIVQDGTGKNKIRIASLLYVTVRGAITVGSVIQQATIPRVSFGDIPYTLEVKNTGNSHFFAYVKGALSGFSAPGTGTETTNLLLPQTVRNVSGTITAPFLPGVYTATYGYTADNGDKMERVSRVIYLPPWFIISSLGVGWLIVILLKRYRRKRTFKGSSPQPYK